MAGPVKLDHYSVPTVMSASSDPATGRPTQDGPAITPASPSRANAAPVQSLPAEQALLATLQLATAISSAHDLAALLQQILSQSRYLTGCDAGTIFLIETDRHGGDRQLRFAAFQNNSLQTGGAGDDAPELRLPVSTQSLVGWTAHTGEVLALDDAYAIPSDRPYSFNASIDHSLGYRSISMLVLPLRSSDGTVVGVLQLINALRDPRCRITPQTAAELVRPFTTLERRQAEALASLAAVCVERTRLLDGQQRQIDSMIALLAGAIDARSPHTGLHCSRVPQLAEMIARAAEECSEGPLAGFRFADDKAWQEFRTAAWLHDCGKISTPEAVVEKATKLQAPHDRIHEIRTRFEVLHRDARIAMLEGLLAGGDRQALEAELQARLAQLQADFAFVAQCNLGSEGMDEASIDRLHQIAAQSWQRHFDDRLGLGWEERSRRGEQPEQLPAPEPLLADKPHHRIPRSAEDVPSEEWKFSLEAPPCLYDRGELHNLSIRRGTLTGEEIYKIREHMIHTIMMLETMEFPSHMARVADYAGGHHETLDGSGYPRGLNAEQLSIPARILAIADIFEALTASDRPYKPGKPLSEALAILAAMVRQGRLDADLFALFLRSGIPQRYGERFLNPAQLDAIDSNSLLSLG